MGGLKIFPDLFDWAASRPSAVVLPFNATRYHPRALHPAERVELEFRRALDLEPVCPIFRIEEGVSGSRWFRSKTSDDGIPWLTRGRRA
jgi:hypothetical protein